MQQVYDIANPSGSSTNTTNLTPQYNQYPNDIVLENQVLTKDLLAWNTITIGENVTVAPGLEVTLTAGGEVVVLPNVTLPSNLIIVNRLPIECSGVNTPATTSEITAFCNSDLYKDNRQPVARIGSTNPDRGSEESTLKTQLLNAYPNPFGGSTTIAYSVLEEGQTVRVFVTDMMGKQVAELVSEINHAKGSFKTEFDATGLASGVYFYTLESGESRETKRLVLIE